MNDYKENSLLSRKEAALFLGVKETTLAVWKCTQRYDIPVIKVGRLVRYRYRDLLGFFDQRTVSARPERSHQGGGTPWSR